MRSVLLLMLHIQLNGFQKVKLVLGGKGAWRGWQACSKLGAGWRWNGGTSGPCKRWDQSSRSLLYPISSAPPKRWPRKQAVPKHLSAVTMQWEHYRVLITGWNSPCVQKWDRSLWAHQHDGGSDTSALSPSTTTHFNICKELCCHNSTIYSIYIWFFN